jgi:hypothetical protein
MVVAGGIDFFARRCDAQRYLRFFRHNAEGEEAVNAREDEKHAEHDEHFFPAAVPVLHDRRRKEEREGNSNVVGLRSDRCCESAFALRKPRGGEQRRSCHDEVDGDSQEQLRHKN